MSDITLNIKIEPIEDGYFLALSDDLPGLLAEGRTYTETLEIAQDVARKLIESYIEHDDPLPESNWENDNIHLNNKFCNHTLSFLTKKS